MALRNHAAAILVVSAVAVGYAAAGVFLARAGVFAREPATGTPAAHPTRATVLSSTDLDVRLDCHGYRLTVRLTPNRPDLPERIAVEISRGGRPVSAARVRVTVSMADMPGMGTGTSLLPQSGPGTWARSAPPLTAGRWRLHVAVEPRHARPFATNIPDGLGA